ncbi:MAG: MarR family transcriptional regulator [Acidobacteria bacterium]|nr:MAG: MarR family transcriptional regulator [Acidobacteriota bacterium]
MPSRPGPPRPDPKLVAQRLHSAAIHLLRRLRVEDQASGLTAPRLSALSVVVFGGPIRMGDLATAEQVRPPTISRLVKEMERDGLVRRVPDPGDERVQQVQATAKGRRVLEEGRRRRVHRLAADLADLPPRELRALARGAELLERIARHEPGRAERDP